MKKIILKLISLVLCISIFAPACVFAYMPGAREYTYEFNNLISAEKGEISGGDLVLKAGGYASMDLLLPFTAAKIHLEYSSKKDVNLTVATGRNTYSAPLSAKETKASLDILNEEVADLVLTIGADNDITITSLVFEKEDADVAPSNVNSAFVFSKTEEALLTTVAIHDKAVVLYDRGAMRYLDFDNTRTTPKYFNGELYLPAFALARALDMYLEDYSDMEYVFLRSVDDKIEIFYEKGEAYFTTAGIKKKLDLKVYYEDGLTWLPAKQIAELSEKTVAIKNGIMIIDLKLNVENILASSAAFSELSSKLDRYIIQDNSGGKTYHVAQTDRASDRNMGTENYPFETISKAAEIAKPGDTVIIHEGIYSETIVPKNSGTPSKPIRYMAADGENVTISNIAELSGFLRYNDKLWCVKVPQNMGKYKLQVFHEGKALTPARHPNTHNEDNAVAYYDSIDESSFAVHGDIKVRINQGDANSSAAMAGTLYATSLKGLLDQEEKDYWKGATWIGLKGYGWNLSPAPVTGSEFGRIYLDDGGYTQDSIVYYFTNYNEDWGFLSNHINCVDIPGEWYYDGETLFIIPPEGVNGEDLTVSVKQGFTSFDLEGKSFIELHNINTRAASVAMAGKTEHNVINGGLHEYVSYATWVQLGGAEIGYEKVSEVSDDTADKGATGIFVDGANHAIVNTRITNTATRAIVLDDLSEYAFIYNNEVDNAGYAVGGTAISVRGGRTEAQTGGHQIISNTIHAYAAHGISINNSETIAKAEPALPIEIAFNHFYDGVQYARDSGLLYQHYGNYGHDREYSSIHHNLFHDGLTTHVGGTSINGVYVDNATSGIDIHNNLIYWKDIDSPLTPVYVQRKSTFPNDYSYCPTYANKSLDYVEEDADFSNLSVLPNGKPFLVGADHASNERFVKDGKFLTNYEAAKRNYDSIYASDAVLENGAYLTEDGYAVLGNTGTITFKDVDLTDMNNIVAYIAGNEAVKDYVLRLKILKDGVTVESDPVALMITSRNYDGSNEVDMRIMELEGKHDIVLSIDSPSSKANELRLIRIRTEYTTKEPVLPTGAEIIYGGELTRAIHNTTYQLPVQTQYSIQRFADRTHHYANWIFENTCVYEGVEITRDFTDFIAYVQANTGDNNYYMQVRIGSETGSVVAEADLNYVPESLGGRLVEGYVWRKHKIKLAEPLKAGTYDFYVTFEDRDTEGYGKGANTCDIAYFGFYNDSEQSVK